MTIKAVIFDLDGTLVDTAPDLMLATNHVLSRLERRPITMDEVRSFVGHGARVLIARGCAATGEPIDEKTLDFYFAEFLRFYEKNIAVDSVAFPGVIELLRRCAASRPQNGGVHQQTGRAFGPASARARHGEILWGGHRARYHRRRPSQIRRPIWKR